MKITLFSDCCFDVTTNNGKTVRYWHRLSGYVWRIDVGAPPHVQWEQVVQQGGVTVDISPRPMTMKLAKSIYMKDRHRPMDAAQ